MKRIIMIVTIVLLLTACNSDKNNQEKLQTTAIKTSLETVKNNPIVEDIPFRKSHEITKAKNSIKAFASTLKNELMRAMKAGGPVTALSACNTKAPKITAHASDLHGMQLSRTSLKNRNENNVPNDWQKVILEDFEIQKSKGVDIKTIVYAEIIDESGKKQFRFMKPIPTQSLCLSCHGNKISSSTKKRIKTLYPEDKAIGFKEGDIRGAFVIINNL